MLEWRFGLRNGALAQLGERLLCKQDVVGSIPSGSTISFGNAVALRVFLLALRRSAGQAPDDFDNFQRYTACESKETKFADLSCEGRVGGSFDIVKRCSFVPFDPHPGEEQEQHVNSG